MKKRILMFDFRTQIMICKYDAFFIFIYYENHHHLNNKKTTTLRY